MSEQEAAQRAVCSRVGADFLPASQTEKPNLSVETATAWRDLYEAAAAASRGGGTAQARVDLLNDIIRILGGGA